MQMLASLAVILAATLAWYSLRGAGRTGNRIQLDLDLQLIDLGPSTELIGELMIVLTNMGVRHQRLNNLFIEVRPSRRAGSSGMPIVPVFNLVGPDDYPPSLAPAVRQAFTWTFEVPRDERLLRITALISTARRLNSDVVPELAAKNLWTFGPSARYLTRVFETSTSGFRRF